MKKHICTQYYCNWLCNLFSCYGRQSCVPRARCIHSSAMFYIYRYMSAMFPLRPVFEVRSRPPAFETRTLFVSDSGSMKPLMTSQMLGLIPMLAFQVRIKGTPTLSIQFSSPFRYFLNIKVANFFQ